MKSSQNLSNLLTEPHVYTSSSIQRLALAFILFMAVLFAGFALVSLILKGNIDLFLLFGTVTLFLAALSFLLWRMAQQNFLITGREGIIFTYAGYTAFSPWENISRIARPPYWRSDDALQLREAPEDMPIAKGIQEYRPAMQIRKGASTMLGQKSNSPYDIYHYIPLLFLGGFWRKSELKSDLERYAPQVFQKSPPVSP